MNWTTEPPTKPGWYWMRGWDYFDSCNKRRLFTHVVEVAEEDNWRFKAILTKISAFGAIAISVSVDCGCDYEWCGPIDVPEGGLNRRKLEVRGKHFDLDSKRVHR